nr:MAG TPA: hypothetical protein [Caudoviricetes sp.]DAZ09106.1 MAG TPA: hypothetical protein [Caudoviricetes sp.]
MSKERKHFLPKQFSLNDSKNIRLCGYYSIARFFEKEKDLPVKKT